MIITKASAAGIMAAIYVFKVKASATDCVDTAVNRNEFNHQLNKQNKCLTSKSKNDKIKIVLTGSGDNIFGNKKEAFFSMLLLLNRRFGA